MKENLLKYIFLAIRIIFVYFLIFFRLKRLHVHSLPEVVTACREDSDRKRAWAEGEGKNTFQQYLLS